ncbi:PIN domain-containing protein [Asticcacaulis endophyticus]|uniref:DUF4935 domain-containing protein n=1 Tax=Asticcacaulis endophyticus TaxID=1395890 RepID=A0A918Q737_9CAUL|nr:PIN domain-containing protein [Asticcacaulis endophyticus]GGZ32873.1 hypothetical protein GCM10011273_18940 [Asticcacaulis endophyticus]
MDVHAIASAGVPVLCIDTCSILDIMRDPTRESAKPHDRRAAMDLVVAAESGGLLLLMAEQVAIEFADHDQKIQDEAKRNLKNIREQVERINELSAAFGAPGVVDLAHLDDHVARARAVVGRWLSSLETLVPSALAPAKAFARLNAGIAPARRGKDSSKDCLIYETYLEGVSALRLAGFTKPIVFLSSNTNEYLTDSRILKPEIATEFSTISIVYAANMSGAKHALGI